MSKAIKTGSNEVPSSDGWDDELIEQTRVRRVFNWVQFFTLSITFMSTWEAIASNLYTVFYNGGPNTLVFGFLLVWAGACSQAASLAEMASVQPIAGAMYHWTYLLAPEYCRRFMTWLQAFLTWAGWISMTVGIGNTTVAWLTSIVKLNYQYTPLPWHGTLIIWALLLVTTTVNVWKFGKLVPWIECCAGFFHITMFVAFSITLLALAPKQDARFVFLGRVDSSQTSGWTNDFVSWNLGLQTSVWAFVGFDAAVHLSEEVRHARTTVPSIMVYTNVVNGFMGWLFILVILFCVGNVEEALQYPQPMLAVLLNATGSVRAATVIGSLFVAISVCSLIVNVASVSRLTWSWARDGGLPKWLSLVDARKRVPARAIYFAVAIVTLLCLVNIGSTVALQVFISLSTIALYISYLISIFFMILRRLSNTTLERGAWSMGRFGMPVNIFALVYTAYIIIWLPFPSTLPITASNFNYSGPILGLVVMLALGLWLVRRHGWNGLREDVVEVATKEDYEG